MRPDLPRIADSLDKIVGLLAELVADRRLGSADRLLTDADGAARVLDISRDLFDRMVNAGELPPAIRLRGALRYSVAELRKVAARAGRRAG